MSASGPGLGPAPDPAPGPASGPSVPPAPDVTAMNPERVQMLAEAPREKSPKPPLHIKREGSLAPFKVTGANGDALGDWSNRSSRGSQKSDGGSFKRSISELMMEAKEKRVKQDKKPRITPAAKYYTDVHPLGLGKQEGKPSQPGSQALIECVAPMPDDSTQYLTSLLRNRNLNLCLQAAPTKKNDAPGKPKTYTFLISNAGMVQHERLSMLGHTRALPLSLHDQDISSSDGAITRTVIGELLEDVWPRLTKSDKYMYARQLRNLLHKMRRESMQKPNFPLGSIESGTYTLLQDKHPDHTYYAIRPSPNQKQFMALLMSTLYESVPKAVSKALISQFRVDYPSVLTHGALCPKNIVVSNNLISWILGWDCAGQYPVWWEYARFFEARTSEANSDWYSYAAEIFDEEFPAELAAYQGIARCQQP
ncbi:aminoglycoside 3 phosphotransferase choline kinase [Fusarium globosum]|uniref:Aminoglycoside 3 phosphotransferase choline kinase n=1 Tax=Fusarium globosum TaxID=78864 RepID=A0A8H6DIL1_9HYPO|nr:aminoglycoside 3 phosphotransferase choline kinase [Fusarium globosum]